MRTRRSCASGRRADGPTGRRADGPTGRRAKLFAHWLADKQHLAPGEAEILHKAVLAAANGPGHDDALLALVQRPLFRRRGDLSRAELAAGLAACAGQA